MTLNQYIERRNGVPLGASGALRNMLRRSFGAGTLAGFWQYWNPIFGYYLAHSVLKKYQDDIKAKLNKDFDVILESDHIHLEYQPRKR